MPEMPSSQPDELKAPDTEIVPEELIVAENEKEAELSPEVIKKIMEKVQDIDKKGTAYTGVRFSSFEKVLD